MKTINGARHEIIPSMVDEDERDLYPETLANIDTPPKKLYVIGDPKALSLPSIAIIGNRKATPYGKACARRFAGIAVARGLCIVSGGARGVDAEAHRMALEAGGVTVAVLPGGLDNYYPHDHFDLFQRIVDAGGALVSEQTWDAPVLPYKCVQRNRITVALAKAVLVPECGMPSGTFSACDFALDYGRDILAVPGAITSKASAGPNNLIVHGAMPIVDDATFEMYLDAMQGDC